MSKAVRFDHALPGGWCIEWQCYLPEDRLFDLNEIKKEFLKVWLKWFYCFLPGLQSVSNEQMDSNTFDIVNAGLQLSFNISRHITPWLLILQWYIRVRNVTCLSKKKSIHIWPTSNAIILTFGGLNGYSDEKWMSRKNTPPSYTEPGGPRMVDTHS